MSAGKIIAYIVAAILVFFGVLFIWSAFSPEGNPANIVTGGISAVIGLGLIWLAGRKKDSDTQVVMKIDLSGDIDLDTLQCDSCGGTISSENITVVAGAPMVKCPFCGSEYQITEEPKW